MQLKYIKPVLYPVLLLHCFMCAFLYIFRNDGSLISEFIIFNVILYLIFAFYVYKQRLFIYFDLLFYVIFPFYFWINFILRWYCDISVFSYSKIEVLHSVFICCSFWSFGIFIALLRPKCYSVKSFFAIFIGYINCHFSCERNLFVLFLLALFCSVFFLSQVSGISISSFLSYSRLELINQVSQDGWYLKYFVIAYSWFVFSSLFNKDAIPVNRFLYLIIPVVLYFISLISVGSRREIVFVLSYFFIFYLLYVDGAIGFRVKLIVISIVFALVFFGALRYGDEQDINELLLNAFGEFIFPINTFIYYFNKGASIYEYGLTYLNVVYNFIPKVLYPDKPVSLAIQFANLVALPGQEFIMGYAYTPITESFVNFGFFCIFIFPLLLSFLSYFIEFISVKYPFLAVVFLSQALNFQRSEVTSLLFEMFFLILCFYFCDLFSRLSLKK